VVNTGDPGAVPSVQRLHKTEHSSNFSGRSTQILEGFASAQADNTGNGGVGVSNWLAITPGVNVTSQLASKAVWTQTFTNTGNADIKLSLNLHIPDMEIGLIGVPPNRTGPSNTETALAQVELATSINRAGGTLEHGGDFKFGMKASEKQFPLGTGPNVTTFSNFACPRSIQLGQAADQSVLNPQGQWRRFRSQVHHRQARVHADAGHAAPGRHPELRVYAHRRANHARRRAGELCFSRRSVRLHRERRRVRCHCCNRAGARKLDAEPDRCDVDCCESAASTPRFARRSTTSLSAMHYCS
jgi:hypothetical protein